MRDEKFSVKSFLRLAIGIIGSKFLGQPPYISHEVLDKAAMSSRRDCI